jgi:hypothetical protein
MTNKKTPDLSEVFPGGATWIRTRDTRIFSPLLYRLSYGTIPLRIRWDCKCSVFFHLAKSFFKKVMLNYKSPLNAAEALRFKLITYFSHPIQNI